jgi:UDP-N-acetylmuramate dehydrogenase
MKIEEGISLAQFTTLGVGGDADFFTKVGNADEVKQAIDFAKQKSLPVFFLGGGANLLFDSKGFRGLVIKSEIHNLEFTQNSVKAGSGIPLAAVVMESASRGLAGLENLAGIPGSVGGSIAGNANEIGEKLISAKILTPSGEIREIDKDYFEFAYRFSSLKKNSDFLIEVELQLTSASEDLKGKVSQIAREKIYKQPYEKTAGSWFKNPADKKAWELIEAAGCRGLRVGDAAVSEKHANFFQNVGDATSQDFLELERVVKEKVLEKFSIELEREVVVVGENQSTQD